MEQDPSSFDTLEKIVARLRALDGCPWDRAQSHASLKPYLIEEAYEVLQALDEENTGKLCEELGDLLLQILLHAQIAKEASEFSIRDVIKSISTKLIRRHPHVFGQSRAANAEEVALEW
jgi:tetrapyrrole methylase family protein/MazG family protein